MTDDSLAERIMSLSPQSRALGLELVATSPEVVLKIPYRADLVGEPDTGVLAGGVVTTILDMACGRATVAALNVPTSIATLDLRIDYMRPAAPGAGVTAEAVCYKLTRSVGFVRAQAWDVDPSDPVATAQASFMLNPRG